MDQARTSTWSGEDGAIQAVETFFEKPVEGTVRKARATGGLWNTMVLVAKGKELWSLGWKCFPEMMALFKRLKRAVATVEELRILDAIYDVMPRRNFSSHLLQCTSEQFAVSEMRDVLWSDWGNPERILSRLEKFRKQPATAQDPLSFLYVG